MNIYVIPFAKNELNDQLFGDVSLIKENTISPWQILKNEGEKGGIIFHTIDFFDPRKSKQDDILLVLNHPEESFLWRLYYFWKYRASRGGFAREKRGLFYRYCKYFKRRILLQLEPPVTSTAYHRLSKLRQLYTDIYLITHGFGLEFKHTNFIYDSYNRDEMIKKYFNRPKDKFLTMINANSTPHTLRNELYGERIKAIKFFSQFPDFDLYGPRWNFWPKHPLGWFARAQIKRAWRGVIKDKWEELSHYKFALVFENCAFPGYISEKIFDCFVTGVVPVYLGAPDITKYISQKCFIDARKFRTYRELNNFLQNMKDCERESYRLEAKKFFGQNKDKPFTSKNFVKFLLSNLTSRVISKAAMTDLKLHLGCGEFYLKGYVNIDFPPEHHAVVKVKADLYSDIRDLDYPENSAVEIRSHHVFEHFSRQEALKLLANWRRWLKTGGLLVIETPDTETAFQMLAKTNDLQKRFKLLRHVFGSQETDWAYHKDGWGEQKYRFTLEKFGFENIKCKKSFTSHSHLHPKKLGNVANKFPSEKMKNATDDRLPNITVTAYKSNTNINVPEVIKEILSFSVVGVEDELLKAWLKDIDL